MNPRLHRTTAVLLLGAYFAWIGGVGELPLPVLKDRSQPFPCQDRTCGCLNAADCWNSCCCFNGEEKLAWAQEHGVEVPAGVGEAATHDAAPGGCCVGRASQAPAPEHGVTEASDLPAEADCCGKASCSPPGGAVVRLSDAAKCRGATALSGSSKLTGLPLRCGVAEARVGARRLVAVSPSAGVERGAPPSPPPRVS